MEEDRITIEVFPDSYELVGSAAPLDATTKLGLIEDMIESGELMNPAVKPNDTVYFIYKNEVVLEGIVDSVYSQYDDTTEKYLYHVTLLNSFFNLCCSYPASEYGKTWFKNKAAADNKLKEVKG